MTIHLPLAKAESNIDLVRDLSAHGLGVLTGTLRWCHIAIGHAERGVDLGKLS